MPQFETLMSSKAAMIGLAVVAFLVAALLVLVLVRMLFGGRLRMPGGRARQARLGIVDAFDLDRQRQLIIVRRDNTEHLIMIGGPNDLLIESEIVRVEARDFRDGRRDKTPDVAFPSAPGFADARIPAPFTSADKPDKAPGNGQRPPAEEPLLPMPLPETTTAEAQAGVPPIDPPPAAPRGPTFPLPPRRPPLVAERRPTPPPKLPENISRAEDATPVIAGLDPVPGLGPLPDARPTPMSVPPVAPPRTVPPPFLKPLPPRPPLRPLQRTTPKPLGPTPIPSQIVPAPAEVAAKASEPSAPGPVMPSPPAPAPLSPAPPTETAVPRAPSADLPVVDAPSPAQPLPASISRPEAKPVPPTSPSAEEPDALESLEEEMAKLLGRGPG